MKPDLEQDTITVPAGSAVKPGGDGPMITLPNGGTVGGDGAVSVPNGSSATIADGDKTTTITPPDGGEITPNKQGGVEVPEGTTVQTGSGPKLTVPEGSAVAPGGDITVPAGGSVTFPDENGESIIITVPSGGAVTPTADGAVIVPAGSQVTAPDGSVVTVTAPEGGAVASDGTVKKVLTVTFDARNGAAAVSLTVVEGGRAAKPADPTRAGYTFGGWCTDAACTAAWDFDAPVTASLTLYAKWTAVSGGDAPGGSSGSSSGGGSSRKPSVSVGGVEAGGTVKAGSNGTVTITPAEGYQVEKITVNGREVDVPADGKLTGLKRTDKVVVTFGEIPAPTPVSERFADVTAGAWYEEAVQFAVDNGLFNGTSDTAFAPESTMTRGMLATVLYRLAQEPETAAGELFSDVAGGRYYTQGIAWAADKGIVSGYGNGSFGPEDPITREQLAAMLYRYEQAQGGGFKGMWMFLLDFTDRAEVSEWAYEAVCWMTMNHVLEGKGDSILDPQGQATRAEVAAMLMRYIQTVEK